MARIELSNIGGGGGTTLSLTTTGTSGAATLAGSVLNIPVYQGQLTLTTTGTSGAATLSGDVLNIPQYSGGGGTPAGSAGQVQFNSTPAGSFAASANLAWDNSNVRLNIGAPSAPTARLNVRGGGTTSATSTQIWTNSGNTELMRLRDDGFLGIGTITPSSTLSIEADITNAGISPLTITRTGVTATDASFQIANATNAAGQLLPQFLLRSNFLSGSTIGGAFSGLITNASSSDIGLLFEARTKSNTAISQGWLIAFRGFTTDYIRIAHNGNTVLQSGGTFTDNGYRLDIISASSTHGARVRAPNANSGTNALLVQNTTVSDLYRIEANGKITYWATNTAAGNTGAQTINRPSGTVNFGIGAGSLVVTNSLCTTSSIVFATVRTNDATAYIKNVVPAAGSFTINLGANATAETSVGFFIIN